MKKPLTLKARVTLLEQTVIILHNLVKNEREIRKDIIRNLMVTSGLDTKKMDEKNKN